MDVPESVDQGWTGARLDTSLFRCTVRANASHAVMEMHFALSSHQVGWLGLGHGTRMSNAQMVIMWPCSPACPGDQWQTSYRHASGHTVPEPLSDRLGGQSRVVVGQARPGQPKSGFSLVYVRPLNLSAVDQIHRAPGQPLVWALSSHPPSDPSNPSTLGLEVHDLGFGGARLDLSSRVLGDGTVLGRAWGDYELRHSRRHDVLIAIHATSLSAAWVICAPGAIIVARVLRNRSHPRWVRMHWIFQLATILLTLVGVVLASLANGSGSHLDTNQKRIGFLVVLAMFVQAAQGCLAHWLKRRNPMANPRRNWAHVILGSCLVLLAWMTVFLGIKEWEFLGRPTPLPVIILMGITCVSAAVGYLFLILRQRSPKR